ncbi:hypothetical protein B0H14DRAFT_3902607 [Mycena olivaceomarginata]|nr:hypothetical protein B0H14DRAFT_3902607 [Mycena olivaceomarginata]
MTSYQAVATEFKVVLAEKKTITNTLSRVCRELGIAGDHEMEHQPPHAKRALRDWGREHIGLLLKDSATVKGDPEPLVFAIFDVYVQNGLRQGNRGAKMMSQEEQREAGHDFLVRLAAHLALNPLAPTDFAPLTLTAAHAGAPPAAAVAAPVVPAAAHAGAPAAAPVAVGPVVAAAPAAAPVAPVAAPVGAPVVPVAAHAGAPAAAAVAPAAAPTPPAEV